MTIKVFKTVAPYCHFIVLCPHRTVLLALKNGKLTIVAASVSHKKNSALNISSSYISKTLANRF